MIVRLIAQQIKYTVSQYFSKTSWCSRGNVKVGLDLSHYATKTNLKEGKGVHTSNLLPKSDLSSLKPEADKVGINKLKVFPADFSNLSNVVDNDVVKRTVYDKLVTKANAINNSGLDLKTQYNTDKSDLEKKIDDAENT